VTADGLGGGEDCGDRRQDQRYDRKTYRRDLLRCLYDVKASRESRNTINIGCVHYVETPLLPLTQLLGRVYDNYQLYYSCSVLPDLITIRQVPISSPANIGLVYSLNKARRRKSDTILCIHDE